MAIGVGLHNIPFGIEITATLNETKKNKKVVFGKHRFVDIEYCVRWPNHDDLQIDRRLYLRVFDEFDSRYDNLFGTVRIVDRIGSI